jgi:hypothetical protein
MLEQSLALSSAVAVATFPVVIATAESTPASFT